MDADEIEIHMYAPFFGAMGAFAAITFSSMGANFGTWKAGSTIGTAGVVKPDIVIKSLLPVVMAGIIAIYGLVAAVLISNNIASSAEGYTLYKGYVHFGAGIAVGMTGLAAGIAIGIAGDAGVRGITEEPKLYVGMVLILIFSEVLGLYGLIVGLLLTTKV
ncbi:V-type proton ATPase 16 kDa proteolipid subunit c-like [Parasteatoda tepidariorum]|uniref:V-type proton ATPase 16 kDa proteolipid subunit c-like n=1 Tax=Parasteatoda tepidariorum TaxID=114398 RepID=UPI00077FBA0C|nr:V-type proton ATPase 16 kDa proteolipid subunit-like [Parasteatoda tepidariorum]